MRGIEFQLDIEYGDVLNEILSGIPLNEYDYYISEDEILGASDLPVVYPKVDASYFGELEKCAPYLVCFFNLQAYRRGETRQKIEKYEDFSKSSCQFIVLIADGYDFEIYAKDDQLLLQFIKNASALHAKDIRIKTDYCDGRTRMSVL